jgi:hypothetical protein
MPIQGIYRDRVAIDVALAKTLRTDDMERFRAVPKTVMINQWPDDLDWVIIDSTYPAQIARRYQLILDRRDMVIDRLPDDAVQAAELELRDMLVDYVLTRYPHYFQRDGDVVLSPLTRLAIDVGPSGADPLVAIALLASEDMLLLLPGTRGPNDESVYVLKAGALLFPNDWSLRSHFNRPEPNRNHRDEWENWRAAKQKSEKAARLGKSPSEIHDGHVAHYTQHFASRVDLFFTRLMPGMRTWRRNWGMRLTDELFLHSDALPAQLPACTPQNWADHGYLRSEHETFAKLPKSGAIVFTIKTYLWTLSELVANQVALDALLVANANLAPTMFEYRADMLPTFREFLQRHRGTSESV